jgi:hypothetical protein
MRPNPSFHPPYPAYRILTFVGTAKELLRLLDSMCFLDLKIK